MKQVFWAILAFSLFGCVPASPRYTPEDLAKYDTKQIEGVVVKQSRGSFILKDQEGVDRVFRTGQLTQYIPEGYRSLEGDTVHCTYQEGIQAVLQLTSISRPKQNLPLPNPLEGKITGISKGSSRHRRSFLFSFPGHDTLQVYIPIENAIVTVQGKAPSPDYVWEKAVGSKAQVFGKRVPILRGNGYIYEAEQVHIE